METCEEPRFDPPMETPIPPTRDPLVEAPQKLQPFKLPTRMAQEQEPWKRLYNTPTLASARREIYHFDPQAANDHLDYVIKAQYDHHRDFLKSQVETVVQKETLEIPHGRILKNREVIAPPPQAGGGKTLLVTSNPKKEDLNTIDMIIVGPHIQTTNRGYSRKPDGGFFTT